MRETLNKANNSFARIFSHCIMTIISGKVRLEGRESVFKERRKQKGQTEERKEKEEETYYRKNPKGVGTPSRRLIPVHMMGDQVPHLGFDVGSKFPDRSCSFVSTTSRTFRSKLSLRLFLFVLVVMTVGELQSMGSLQNSLCADMPE